MALRPHSAPRSLTRSVSKVVAASAGILAAGGLLTAAAVAAPTAQASSPAVAATNLRTVLPPATVRPVSNECTLKLTHDADGNVTPLLCKKGGVNTRAWRYFASAGKTHLLRLGRGASLSKVRTAMCYDYAHVYKTEPTTISTEELGLAYYGWHISTRANNRLIRQFTQHGCSKA